MGLQLTLVNCVPDGPITYSAYVEYISHGRADRIETQGVLTNGSFLDFGNAIQGGTLRSSVEAPVRELYGEHRHLTLHFESANEIVGSNPSKTDIRAHLGSIEAQVTAYRESRFRQFDLAGQPVFGLPNGFGVMQPDPPSASEQIWDWKANIDEGLARFAVKANDAAGYPARVRRQFPKATDFTAQQLGLETYQRYNGGAYWQWDDQAQKWINNPPNSYADESFRIENLVRAGTPPGDWNWCLVFESNDGDPHIERGMGRCFEVQFDHIGSADTLAIHGQSSD
jgi:hypothetical protein